MRHSPGPEWTFLLSWLFKPAQARKLSPQEMDTPPGLWPREDSPLLGGLDCSVEFFQVPQEAGPRGG